MSCLKFLSLIFLFSIRLYGQNYETYITVAQDGSGDFQSIQEAINNTKAFPDVPITIYVKSGVYREKVTLYSWNTNLFLVGDSIGETIISYDDHFMKLDLGRNSTFHTYTMKVQANDFRASNLIIENTSGPVGQAVAIHVEADRVVFKNCTFRGHQDTMYLAGENARQYFINCIIEGTTDFIFGAATAYFDACEIRSLKSSYITAASTTKLVEFGLVFNSCKLTNMDLQEGKTYLGRPWRAYAHTVFINCEMGKHIHSKGWKEWNSDGTARYAEYESKGPGANPGARVIWSRQLTRKELKQYTLDRVFRGWDPLISVANN